MVEKIKTDHVPAALGPYTQAIRAGKTLYISGLLGIDPESGELAGKTVVEQSEQISRNVDAILKAAGYSSKDVVKTVVYLSDLSDFKAFNESYAEYFTSEPARTCVEASHLLRNAKVVEDVIAYKD